VFAPLLKELQGRFEACGLKLQIGEALVMTKALVFTIQHFLSEPDRQDGLLVPLFQTARIQQVPTGDPVRLLLRVGLPRLARLATALSFTLIQDALGQDPWSAEEQKAVVNLLGQRMEEPAPLSVEFAYIPLVLGGIRLLRMVVLPGEDPSQTLDLVGRAVVSRGDELSVVPELPTLLKRLLAA
jgi:hypothetical protein